MNPDTPKDTHEKIFAELDTENLVTASAILDQLVTCLYKYHLMNPIEEARHRDLRLPNLGIRANGSVVILDIGLSLLVNKDQKEKGATDRSQVHTNQPFEVL